MAGPLPCGALVARFEKTNPPEISPNFHPQIRLRIAVLSRTLSNSSGSLDQLCFVVFGVTVKAAKYAFTLFAAADAGAFGDDFTAVRADVLFHARSPTQAIQRLTPSRPKQGLRSQVPQPGSTAGYHEPGTNCSTQDAQVGQVPGIDRRSSLQLPHTLRSPA